MTSINVTVPPTLYLPQRHLNDAATALDQARVDVKNAQSLDWISVAAPQYQAELAELDTRLVALASLVTTCQEEWAHARAAARVWGQL